MKKFFVILAIVVFAGAGCTSRLSERFAQVQPPPVVADDALKSTHKPYANAEHGFSFQYPRELSPVTPMNPDVLVQLLFPSYFKTGTNLSSAEIDVTVEPDSGTICVEDKLGEKITQDGVEFNVYRNDDSGAGHSTHQIEYIGLHKGNCYTFTLLAMSVNPELYPPTSRPQVYDQKKIEAVFDEVFKSLKF